MDLKLQPLVLPNRDPIPLRLPAFHLCNAVLTTVVKHRDNAVLEQFVQFAGLGLCVADQVPVPWASGLEQCDWDLVRFGRGVTEALSAACAGDAAAWSKVNAAAYATFLAMLASTKAPTRKEVEQARNGPFAGAPKAKRRGRKSASSSRSSTGGTRSPG
jgi:hypothetical protein